MKLSKILFEGEIFSKEMYLEQLYDLLLETGMFEAALDSNLKRSDRRYELKFNSFDENWVGFVQWNKEEYWKLHLEIRSDVTLLDDGWEDELEDVVRKIVGIGYYQPIDIGSTFVSGRNYYVAIRFVSNPVQPKLLVKTLVGVFNSADEFLRNG